MHKSGLVPDVEDKITFFSFLPHDFLALVKMITFDLVTQTVVFFVAPNAGLLPTSDSPIAPTRASPKNHGISAVNLPFPRFFDALTGLL